jgi:hypothetical protein
MSARRPAATISGERVFGASVMGRVAYIASSISRLVGLEMIEALCPAFRHRSRITVMWIKAVVDVAVKAVRAVEPRAGSEKHPADKPIWPVISVRSAIVRGVVEIPVRTHGSHSDVYSDGNLGLCRRYTAQKASYKNCESKRTDFDHGFSPFDCYRVLSWIAEGQHTPEVH